MQLADFGMARDLMDENYYVSHGGKIPVKWTAPEVYFVLLSNSAYITRTCIKYIVSCTPNCTGSELQEILYGQ